MEETKSTTISVVSSTNKPSFSTCESNKISTVDTPLINTDKTSLHTSIDTKYNDDDSREQEKPLNEINLKNSLTSESKSLVENVENVNYPSTSSCQSLPRKFEKLSLSTSISTDSEATKDDTSDISSCKCIRSKLNSLDLEGTVQHPEKYDSLSNCCHSYHQNISCNIVKSPSNPSVKLTDPTENNIDLTKYIDKCLSQSFSTATITSSNLTESPSSLTTSIKVDLSLSPSTILKSSLHSLSTTTTTNNTTTSIASSNCVNNNNIINGNENNSRPKLTPFPSPTSSNITFSSSLTSLPKLPITTKSNVRILPKTHSLDLGDEHYIIHVDHEDIDADVDEVDDDPRARIRRQILALGPKRGIFQTRSQDDGSNIHPLSSIAMSGMKHSKSELATSSLNSPPKSIIPKIQSSAFESRPIYPNVPYSPYGSPYGSPRSNRRRTPLRESRRVSIEQSGSYVQLNQYKLMDQIGQGSYGLVKLAYSDEDSVLYAMKILSKRRILRKAGLMARGPKRTTSPLDRVYREIAVLKKLDHPNVVKLIEVLDDPLEDSLYLVFELVQQGEVLSVPTDRPLSEERAWCVFRDALQGLEYLHYQRIIHADIKPGNLLLGEGGTVKIADLGVCNEFFGDDAAMNNGSTAGTPAFRAPETLIPGQHLYSGKAADIWALGATLYSLVYGNVPFVAKSVPVLYEKIKHDQLIFPEFPAISSELRDLIEKILTKDPSKRITLPQIKEHPWVTSNGAYPLPSEDENCRLVQISDEDIHTVVKSIPKLDTLILIKTMLKNHSFQNPFSRGGISGRAPQRGGSRWERFTSAGRSNSAPGAYHLSERQLSCENILPSVSEGVAGSCNESSDHSNEG